MLSDKKYQQHFEGGWMESFIEYRANNHNRLHLEPDMNKWKIAICPCSKKWPLASLFSRIQGGIILVINDSFFDIVYNWTEKIYVIE